MAPETFKESDPKRKWVVIAARSLAGLINTARMYGVEHPVYQRASEQQAAILKAAMNEAGEVLLFFIDHQVRYGSVSLDPESALMGPMARCFEGRGIKGISLLPGLTVKEVAAFISIVVAADKKLETGGLAASLKSAGVYHITEQKVVYGIVGQDRVQQPPSQGPGTPPAKAVAGDGTAMSSWTLDEKAADASFLVAPRSEGPRAGSSRQSRREFVQSMFDAASRQRITMPQASEILSLEIEGWIKEQAEDARAPQEGERRQLDQVKDVLLEELDNLHLAAVLLDNQQRIIAANRKARDLLGLIDAFPPGSALDRFVQSGAENQTVDVAGAPRRAHRLLAPYAGQGNLMLICLE